MSEQARGELVERRRAARAQALEAAGLLRSIPSPELHRTARLAAHIAQQADAEVLGAVHLLDDQVQHRVAAFGGVPLVRTPLDDSMCVQVLDDEDVIYTGDATQERRFDGNPFTSGPDPVRLYCSVPLRLSDGTAVGTLCVFSTSTGVLLPQQRDRLDDLAQQTSAHLEAVRLTRDLEHLATHDHVTGVANRHLLAQQLERALSDPTRRPHEPGLLLVDLDSFKRVNDTLGHRAGDAVLASTARRLRSCVRESDLVARLGGDEFAVLLRELPDPAWLDELVGRVEERCSAPHVTEAGEVTCTVSVGRALGLPDDLAYELLGRADVDMYERKSSSR